LRIDIAIDIQGIAFVKAKGNLRSSDL